MVYGVPLSDGTVGYVQAIAQAMVNVIDIAVLRMRTPTLATSLPEFHAADAIALAATWRQDLNSGQWAALGLAPLTVAPSKMPNQVVLASGTKIGIKHFDGGVVVDLLDAWHGLSPWNVYYKEDYFDSLLLPGVQRPSMAKVLSPSERAAFRAREAHRDA